MSTFCMVFANVNESEMQCEQNCSNTVVIGQPTTCQDLCLVYFAISFAAGTGVNWMSKIFKDDLNTSLNNNCMGESAEFSKFSRGKRGKTVTLYFNDKIPHKIMSALKTMYKQVAYWLLISRSEIPGYFCKQVKFVDSNSVTCATVICKRFSMSG